MHDYSIYGYRILLPKITFWRSYSATQKSTSLKELLTYADTNTMVPRVAEITLDPVNGFVLRKQVPATLSQLFHHTRLIDNIGDRAKTSTSCEAVCMV